MAAAAVKLGFMQLPNRPAAFAFAVAATITLACTVVVPRGTVAAGAHLARSCPQAAAVVVALRAAERRDACQAIAQAAAFLARQGVAMRAPIELHLVDALPPAVASSTRTGVYLHEERRAYVLRRARWPADAAPLGLPMTRALYRSAIVHEAVHAIAAEHFPDEGADVVAHEYLAYVGQLESLAPALRERALRAGPASAGDEVRRLNLYVLGMRPDSFAALAWRHWSAPGHGATVVHAVLEDGVLPGG